MATMTQAENAIGQAGTDISNWRNRPHSLWAFRNITKVLNTAAVANDPPGANPLTRAETMLRASPVMAGFLKATATDAMVVLSDGKIVLEHYAHGNDRDTPHILMSATKAVMGLVLGTLQHRDVIDLEAPVTRYVPEVAATAYAGATLQQMLDMRTGVVLDEQETLTCSAAAGWDPVPAGQMVYSLHEYLERLAAPPAPHGGVFRYTSANTDLLGWAVERATGKTVASLISEVLWKPMRAERPALMTLDGNGAPRAAGGLCATARDFARIGQLLIDGGRSGDDEVLPGSLVDDILRGGDAAAWRDGEWGKAFAPISKNLSYHNGWYIIDEQPKIIFAMGIHGQNLFVDTENRIVIAKLSSWSKMTDYVALPLTHVAVGSIRRSVLRARRRASRPRAFRQ